MILFNRKTNLMWITCWIHLVQNIAGLKLNRLIIDSPVETGSSIWLHCDFQLDKAEKRAFTSKFYKNNIEFYRYSILNERLKPTKKYFVQPAVHVNMSRSNGSHVFLENVEPLTEGTISCEINTDEPFFMSMQAQQDLRVYVLPKKRLQLINLKENYKEGDLVNVQCRSSASKPSMVIRWFINNQQITKNEENLNITYQTFEQDSINGLSYTSSNLTFYLCANTSSAYNGMRTISSNPKARSIRQCIRRGRIGQLFKKNNGVLYIRCVAVLSQIMDESSEELIIEEKRQNARFEQTVHSESLEAPKIQGNPVNMRYQIGDWLQLNCSSGQGGSLPAPYLEWFVNNRRINEQYVYNYATTTNDQFPHSFMTGGGEGGTGEVSNTDLPLKSGQHHANKLQQQQQNKMKSAASHLTTNSNNNPQMPESNSHSSTSSLSRFPSSSSSFRSSSHDRSSTYKKTIAEQTTDQRWPVVDQHDQQHEVTIDKAKDFHNEYLFSNNLKKLNLLSLQHRNKHANSSTQSDLNNSLSFSSLLHQSSGSSLVNTFHQQQQSLYNTNINLTRLQNIIYQHYADYSLKPAQHRISIRFRVMKKHYQTLDFALRVRCTATYGKVIAQDQSSTIAVFADGRTSQYFNALEINAASTLHSSFVIILSILHSFLFILKLFIGDRIS